MNLMAIESASTVCGVSLFIKGKLIEIDEIFQPRIHGERLPVIIEKLLSKHSVKVEQLNAIAVSSGPGSYTGLRIGMSLAKGLAAAGEIPIIPVPTLEVMNLQITQNGSYWLLLHSHKNMVFSQRFNSGNIDSEIECDVFDLGKYKPLFGFNLDSVCGSTDYEKAPPSSKNVGELAMQHFEDWVEEDLNKVTPNYITNFNLGIIKTH